MGLFSSLKKFFGFKVEEPGPEIQVSTAIEKKKKPRKKNPSTKKRETKRKKAETEVEILPTVEADPLLEEPVSSTPEAGSSFVEVTDNVVPLKPKKPRKPRKPRKPKSEHAEKKVDNEPEMVVLSNNAIDES